MTSETKTPNAAGFDLHVALYEVDDALKAFLLKYAEKMPYSLIYMGKLALGAPGKVMPWRVLAERGEEASLPKWPLFPILSFMASAAPEDRGEWRAALPVAVAVELAIAAADLIDEAADHDPSPIIEEYGAGQALNTANLMLVMAQQALLWEARDGNTYALKALGVLQDMLVEAAVGQHLDMSYEKMGVGEVTPAMSGEMTDKKAGALMSGAFRMGALMSGADEHIVELLAKIGRQLGGMAQITNDLQDVLPQAGDAGMSTAKTDLRQRKRTLPVVYALREEESEPNALQIAFSKPPGSEDEIDEEELRRAIQQAGGLNFAFLVLDVYKGNAAEALDALEAVRSGARDVLAPVLWWEE
ncbi:MAG: polyprenyl synthetase family protein [Chloroflexota bacterium]